MIHLMLQHSLICIFLKDIKKLKNKKFFNYFFKKYGHLRPNMYDIKSKPYLSRKKIFINLSLKQNRKSLIKKRFIFKSNKIKLINFLLQKNDLKNINAWTLIDYLIKSIQYREKAKFIFSKNLNFILNLFQKDHKKNNLSKEQICFLDYFYKKKNIKKIKKEIYINKKNKEINQAIILPQVIYEPEAAYISPYQNNLVNFVTNKKVTGQILFFKN